MPEGAQKQPEPEQDRTTAPEGNGALNARDLGVIRAELEEERKAKAALEQAMAERDRRIAELQASVSAVQQAAEAATAELSQLKEAHSRAVARYLEVVRAANPTLPADAIAGTTIEEIDAAAARGLAIANAVKANLQAEARHTKVPAGAPARAEISLEGLSPREKIIAGLQTKGGISQP